MTATIYTGQVWVQKDRKRYVRVQFVCGGGKRVRIQRCTHRGTTPKGARSTEVSADRFKRFDHRASDFILTAIL